MIFKQTRKGKTMPVGRAFRVAIIFAALVNSAFLKSAAAQNYAAESVDGITAFSPNYLEIDGHWYQFTTAQPGQAPWSFYGSLGSIAWTATATNCRRADGGWIGTEPPMMYYGPSAFGIPINFVFFRLLPTDSTKGWMHYDTRYGNVICDNEIPSPIPDQIFRNGFDPTGATVIPGETIFLNGFEVSP
jgi:hypothetical protein